jgi:hypothetical protein
MFFSLRWCVKKNNTNEGFLSQWTQKQSLYVYNFMGLLSTRQTWEGIRILICPENRRPDSLAYICMFLQLNGWRDFLSRCNFYSKCHAPELHQNCNKYGMQKINSVSLLFLFRLSTEPSPPCSSDSPQQQDQLHHHWNHHNHRTAIMGLSTDLPTNGTDSDF